jgi:valacyclovir hydrolase
MSWFEHGTSRIYYEEHGAGDPVLLLPGWSQSAEELAAVRDALAASYRVIAADLPGSGRSQPQPRAYAATYYEDDAAAFAALLRQLGVVPAHLVGFSDGGEIALLMAALTPDVARSVATWGAAGRLSDPEGQLRQVMYNLVDHPIPPMQGFRDHLVATYGEANARAMSQSQAGAVTAILEGASGGELALASADQITCPVLLITGAHDFFAPPSLVAQAAARIRGAETMTADGAGHDVQNSHPDWLTHTILDWLARR